MKHKLFITAGMAVYLASCASTEFEIRENEVPANVVSALKSRYPNAQVIKWEAEKEDGKFYFEAEIKDGGKESEIHISPDGAFITEGD